jgi:muconolactone D-isomerase
MKYLVTMELIGTPQIASPQERVQWLEQIVIPSEEAATKLEAEGKILAGGDLSGRRGWAFIMEAASNEELSQLLMSIPQWTLLQVNVTPLDSISERLAQERESLKQMKAALQ